MSTTRDKGIHAEAQAAAYLEGCGLSVLQANYRWKGGDFVLICREGDTLCFVEVRSRRHPEHGPALATITRAKQRRIVRTAQHFLAYAWQGGLCPCRFDVVAIEPGEVVFIRDAFQAA